MLSIIIYLYWSAFYLTIFLGGRLIFFFLYLNLVILRRVSRYSMGRIFLWKKQTVCQILLQEERNRKILASAEHLQGGVSGTWYETSSCQHSCQWNPAQQILDVCPLQPYIRSHSCVLGCKGCNAYHAQEEWFTRHNLWSFPVLLRDFYQGDGKCF